MRRRSTALLGVAALALLAGCSSAETDGAGATTPEPSTASPVTTVSDEPSPELEAWASEFCTAASPAFNIGSKIDLSRAGDESPEGQQQFYAGLYDAFAQAHGESASGVASVAQPPVDGADRFVALAGGAFTEARDRYATLRDDARAVDLTDAAALQTMGAGLQTLGDPTTEAFTQVDAVTPTELDEVLTTVPECQALGG